MAPRRKALTETCQERVFGQTQCRRGGEACAQLAQMGEGRLVYLTDVRDDQNVGATCLRFTQGEEFFELLEIDSIVPLPMVVHENRIFHQSWLGAYIDFDPGIVA